METPSAVVPKPAYRPLEDDTDDDDEILSNPELESKVAYRKRWISLAIAYIGTFVMYCQTSTYWTSLWPYLSQVDTEVEESFVGFVVAAYSIGQAVASPLFGLWSKRISSTRVPIIVGLTINVIGNTALALVEVFPAHQRKWAFLVARFVAGCGAGNQGVISAYVAMASHLKERDMAVSFQAATCSLAILLGPGFAALFTFVGYPGFVYGPIHLDMYSCTAFLMVALGCMELVLLVVAFREYYVSVHEEKWAEEVPEENAVSPTSTVIQHELRPFDRRAAFTCITVRVVMLFCVTYDDTIGSPFTMAMFNWSRTQAVFYNGLIDMSTGIIDFVGNLWVGNFVLKYVFGRRLCGFYAVDRKGLDSPETESSNPSSPPPVCSVRERTMIAIGLVFFMLFYVVSFSYPGLPMLEKVPKLEAADDSTIQGCFYSWCSYTTQIYLWQYIGAFMCLPIAFICAFTPNSTLFSKVLGPRNQSFMQGVFVGCGNFAMAIGPIMVGYVFEFTGPRIAWLVAMCVTLAGMVVVFVNWKHMIPYHELFAHHMQKKTVIVGQKVNRSLSLSCSRQDSSAGIDLSNSFQRIRGTTSRHNSMPVGDMVPRALPIT